MNSRLLTLTAAAFAWFGCAGALALTRDETERRVEALLARMTLDEKIGQLNLVPNSPSFMRADIGAGRIGGVLAFQDGQAIADVQAAARGSRLGIPLLVGLDVLHGLRTMFPLPLGQAASFDPPLAREAATIAGREAAAIGINWTFAPMVDLARDPRWGRMIEGAGEDAFLGRAFARAQVDGYREGGVIATLKHFAGYGAARGGRDYDEADIGLPDLVDSYLPPFRAGIEAGAGSVMSGFHALNGMPASANPDLMTSLLRGRLGFGGFVVSDWTAINELIEHGVAAGPAEAARKALVAGVDMDMASGLYHSHLAAEVASGRLDEARVTEAARRVLRGKVAAGLFDRPAGEVLLADPPPPPPAAREAARRIARDTMVLLRNEGALPLRSGARVALIGGMAASQKDLVGPHGALYRAEDGVTIETGLANRVRSTGGTVSYAPGCDAACLGEEGFGAAIAAAAAADIVVAVLGEAAETTGEGRSRASLTLPGRQAELLARLVATGRPVVLVLLASRPIELGALVDRLAGLVMAWYPGSEGGPALADILSGDAMPSAKLPISWPRTVGQVPLTYDRRPTGRPPDPANTYTLRYEDAPVTPLFPFGFGLAYTGFAVSDVEILTPTVGPGGTLRVRARLANTGSRDGRETIQLYLRQPVAQVSRPLRQLKGFAKVLVPAGGSRDVAFEVPASELGYTRADGSFAIDPGRFEVFVGTSSDTPLAGSFQAVE